LASTTRRQGSRRARKKTAPQIFMGPFLKERAS
jgi:hypothetical protein